jgi:glycosyltransferase involved in cell wall biosynthesis
VALRLECFIPVYNEALEIEASVLRVLAFCREQVPAPWRVTVLNNGSTDETAAIADRLASAHAEVGAVHLPEKGRGRALRRAFLASEAAWIGYMDADLSTHLRALPEALRRLDAGADLVVGSRLLPGSHTRRRLRREVLSRVYNTLVRKIFGSTIRDHQCGFKFLGRARVRDLVAGTEDDQWFFDTELLILAERAGLRIDEIPVDWIEDLGSTVRILRTIVGDLQGMRRLYARVGPAAALDVTGTVP